VAEEAAAMTDLAAFLLARIAEDEATAQECVKHGLRTFNDYRTIESDSGGYIWWAPPMHAGPWAAFVDQVEAWDPARVLAECAFKRHLIRQAQGSGQPLEPVIGDVISFPLGVLLAMAHVYAAHDDYRDEWRPEVLEPRSFGELTVGDDGAPMVTLHLDVE